MLMYFFSLSRRHKKMIALLADFIFIQLAFWGAFYLRLGSFSELNLSDYFYLLAFLSPLTLVIFIRLGFYRAIVRYLTSESVASLSFGCTLSATLLVLFAYFSDIFLPRSIAIIYFTLLFIYTGG